MKRIASTLDQNELISQLQNLWLSNADEQHAVALSIFEIENIDHFSSHEEVLDLIVQEARRFLRRNTDYISILGHNKLIVSSISSLLKYTHHQVRIHNMLKQVSLLNTKRKMESVRISGGFAVFDYYEQKDKGIFDIFHLATTHLNEALKIGNAVKTQAETHIPLASEVPPLEQDPKPHDTVQTDRRLLSPSPWSARKRQQNTQ